MIRINQLKLPVEHGEKELTEKVKKLLRCKDEPEIFVVRRSVDARKKPELFYNYVLKCFVLIDLKTNAVKHRDIGQMNMYMGYMATEENMPDDNPPVGIILSKEKDELLVEYATYGMDSNLFVSK